jgi:hypothetical protein
MTYNSECGNAKTRGLVRTRHENKVKGNSLAKLEVSKRTINNPSNGDRLFILGQDNNRVGI